ALSEARQPRAHRRAQPLPGRAPRAAPAARARDAAPQPVVRSAGGVTAAALPLHGQRPEPRDARLRLLGREPAPRAVRARRRAGDDRLPAALMRAVVVGGGTWGTGFARLLADRSFEVTLAVRDPAVAQAIAETGHNPHYSRGVDLNGIAATTTVPDDAELYVVAVPSQAFRSVVTALPGAAPVLSLTKGLDPATGERLSTLVRGRSVAVLSGPNMAEEVLAGLPAVSVIASEDLDLARLLQEQLSSLVFRVYVNDDLVGVELCAAAKNVIAL